MNKVTSDRSIIVRLFVFLPRDQLFVGQLVANFNQVFSLFCSKTFFAEFFLHRDPYSQSSGRPVVPTKHVLLLNNFLNSNFKLSRGYLDPALNNPAQGATESKKIIIK